MPWVDKSREKIDPRYHSTGYLPDRLGQLVGATWRAGLPTATYCYLPTYLPSTYLPRHVLGYIVGSLATTR